MFICEDYLAEQTVGVINLCLQQSLFSRIQFSNPTGFLTRVENRREVSEKQWQQQMLKNANSRFYTFRICHILLWGKTGVNGIWFVEFIVQTTSKKCQQQHWTVFVFSFSADSRWVYLSVFFFFFFFRVRHVQNWKTQNSRKQRGGQLHDGVHDGVSIESTSRTFNCTELAKNGRKMSPPSRQVTITAISNWSQ